MSGDRLRGYRLLLLPPKDSDGSKAAGAGAPLEFDPKHCRFDVADKNMVVVLGKAAHSQGVLWASSAQEAESSSSSLSLFRDPSPADFALAFPPSTQQPTEGKTKKKAKTGKKHKSTATPAVARGRRANDDVPKTSSRSASAVAAADGGGGSSMGVSTLRAGEAAVKHSIEAASAAAKSSNGSVGSEVGRQASGGMSSALPSPSIALPPRDAAETGKSAQPPSTNGSVPGAVGDVAPTPFQNSLIFELD